mgnify:CR=1 FL=1
MINAYEKYPENPQILNNLSYFYATTETSHRNPQLSLKMALLAVKNTRNLNAAYLDTLAAAYFASGNKQKAKEIQETVLSMNPLNEEYQKNMQKYR